MTEQTVGQRVEFAIAAAGLSQRSLAERTNISQSTLSRIISGDRTAKLPELVAIAWATGLPLAQLTGAGLVGDRVLIAARASNGCEMDTMQAVLLGFLELNDYLDDQGIQATV